MNANAALKQPNSVEPGDVCGLKKFGTPFFLIYFIDLYFQCFFSKEIYIVSDIY